MAGSGGSRKGVHSEVRLKPDATSCSLPLKPDATPDCHIRREPDATSDCQSEPDVM